MKSAPQTRQALKNTFQSLSFLLLPREKGWQKDENKRKAVVSVGRPRSPERDNAMKKYLDSDGQISTKELAAAAGVPENRVRKWKSEDKWEDALRKKPKKRGGQPRNQNAAGRTPAKDGNRNAVTHGAFAQVSMEDIPEDQAEAIMGMEPGQTALRMNEELQGLLIRKTYLTSLLQQYTDSDKQAEFYTDKIVHMIVPVSAEEQQQAEGMGMELDTAEDPEGGQESFKTAMKTIIKASPFDRMMKVETELNKLNGRIIKLLDSMRAYEMEQSRIDLERAKLKLSRQKATGAFEIDPEEDLEESEDPEEA